MESCDLISVRFLSYGPALPSGPPERSDKTGDLRARNEGNSTGTIPSSFTLQYFTVFHFWHVGFVDSRAIPPIAEQSVASAVKADRAVNGPY